jgi:hypothetical protein
MRSGDHLVSVNSQCEFPLVIRTQSRVVRNTQLLCGQCELDDALYQFSGHRYIDARYNHGCHSNEAVHGDFNVIEIIDLNHIKIK